MRNMDAEKFLAFVRRIFKMRTQTLLSVLCCLLLSTSAFAENTIPVITEDANGNPMVTEVSATEYSARYRATVSTMNDSLMNAINVSANKNMNWHLRTIAVGIGINMEIGVGPLKVGAVPKSRLIFTNSTNPSLP